MGTKRKAVNKKEKTSNARSEPTTEDEIIYSHTDHSSVIEETMNTGNAVGGPDSSTLSPNKVNSKPGVVVRRSSRRHNSVLPNASQQVKNPLDQVKVVIKDEKEEEAALVQEVATSPVVSKRNLEEEAPLALHVLLPISKNSEEKEEEAQLNHVSENVTILEGKTLKQVAKKPNEVSSNDLSYKSLYFDSQKNLESLMETHLELIKELQFTKGKLEVYEKMNDAMVASRLGKSSETTVNISAPKAQGEDVDDHQNVSHKQKNNLKTKRARS